MRRLVAALLVALLALSLVGCGGGGEEEAAAPPDAGAAAPPPPPPGAEAVAVIPDRSAQASETFEPFPAGEFVPAAVQERLETDQAMLLFFYNSDQEVTDDLRKQVNSVVADNRGLIDLVTYDLGKSTSIDDDGGIEVDQEKLAKDENAQQAVRFARELGVDHLPYIVIVDQQGYRIFWARGQVDRDVLDRQVQRAAN